MSPAVLLHKSSDPDDVMESPPTRKTDAEKANFFPQVAKRGRGRPKKMRKMDPKDENKKTGEIDPKEISDEVQKQLGHIPGIKGQAVSPPSVQMKINTP